MPLALVLVLLAALAFAAALPGWPWSRGWSARPAILLGVVLAWLVILIAVEAV